MSLVQACGVCPVHPQCFGLHNHILHGFYDELEVCWAADSQVREFARSWKGHSIQSIDHEAFVSMNPLDYLCRPLFLCPVMLELLPTAPRVCIRRLKDRKSLRSRTDKDAFQ